METFDNTCFDKHGPYTRLACEILHVFMLLHFTSEASCKFVHGRLSVSAYLNALFLCLRRPETLKKPVKPGIRAVAGRKSPKSCLPGMLLYLPPVHAVPPVHTVFTG